MTAKRIEKAYEQGVNEALEKVAFGEFLSSLMKSNPNRQKVIKGSGSSATGNMKTNIGQLASGGTAAATPPATTSTTGG